MLPVLESRLHAYKSIWRVGCTQWILNPHSIIYLKVYLDVLCWPNVFDVIFDLVLNEYCSIIPSLVLLHKLRKLPQENYIINMAALQAISNQIYIKGLDLFHCGSVWLHIWVFNVNISNAVDEVFHDLCLDFELVFQSISKDVNRDESIVGRVQWFKFFIHSANDFQLVKFLWILEEWRRKPKQGRIIELVDALVLKTSFDEPNCFVLQISVCNLIFYHLNQVILICISFAILVKLVRNALFDFRSI